VRAVEPEHVRAPTGEEWDPELSFGIETVPHDVETPKRYWVVSEPLDSLDPEPVPAKYVLHLKRNVKRSSKRGLPTLYPVERNLRRAEEMLASLASMAKTRAKIALIRKIAGVTNDSAAGLLKTLTAARVNDPVTGESLNVERLRNGTILTTGQNTDYEFPAANLDAASYIEAIQADLRAVASRLHMPEWMLTGLADAKYSNAFVIEAPTLKAFKREQARLCSLFGSGRFGPNKSLAWRAIGHAVECGLLPADVYECVSVKCTGPSLETRDKQSEAVTNERYNAAGVKSVRTIREEIGLDPDAEAAHLAAEESRKRRARLADNPTAILTVQKEYQSGNVSRAAAGALLALMGFSAEDAERLLPIAGGVDRTAKGLSPPQPAGLPPPPGPGGQADGPDAPDAPQPPPENPLDSLLPPDTATRPPADLPREQLSGSIYCHRLTEALRRRLREAGFTGTVTASNGVVYYYQDGRRVKNPYAKGGDGKGTSPLHHKPEEARRLAAKAKETLKYAYDNPEKLTADHLHELPKLLASLPKNNLIAFAASLGLKTGPSSRTKDKYVAILAELFPVPAHLRAAPEADEPAPVADPPPAGPADEPRGATAGEPREPRDPQGVDKASGPQGAKPAESREPHTMTREEYVNLFPMPKKPRKPKPPERPATYEQRREYDDAMDDYRTDLRIYQSYLNYAKERYYDHAMIVAKAIAAGKPVPPEVLKDYPILDLKSAGQVRPVSDSSDDSDEYREPYAMTRSEYAYDLPKPKFPVMPRRPSAGYIDGDSKKGRNPLSPQQQADYKQAIKNYLKSEEEYKNYSLETEKRYHDHAVIVAQAIAAGKEVPPEVLEDYPDLAAVVRSKGGREGQ
jgi:tetratricopeptide (TPR) repeat protein